MSKESLTLEKTMKNNEIPKIQQVEAALTESKVFFSLSLSLSFLCKEIQGN
jgi:hypothetical protein